MMEMVWRVVEEAPMVANPAAVQGGVVFSRQERE